MPDRVRDLCPRNLELPLFGSRPSRTPIYPAAVYRCESTDQANRRLGGQEPGYVYQRDRHPNADVVAEKCRQLHHAQWAYVTASGMSAIALAALAHLKSGDHVVISDRLYGRTRVLLQDEGSRLGIQSTTADLLDQESAKAAIGNNTRMMVVETISNPMLRVADLRGLAALAHNANALLLVDNTFASPVICRPLEWGADLVVESITKIMNGHGDLMMGLLCGGEGRAADLAGRCGSVLASWGLASSPFDCWLAERGLGTLYHRVTAASQTAQWLAES